jgi:hypothetical protein
MHGTYIKITDTYNFMLTHSAVLEFCKAVGLTDISLEGRNGENDGRTSEISLYERAKSH